MEKPRQDQEVRERLFRVLREFPVLYRARHGVGTRLLNPFQSLQHVVSTHVNPLILYINDLVEDIKSGTPYLEALERLVLFALRYPYRDRVKEAVDQLASIEGDRPYFMWGLAQLGESEDISSRALRLRDFHRRLHLMNKYYRELFKMGEDTDLIPWRASFRPQADGLTEGSYEFPTRRELESFRNALLCLGDLWATRCKEGWGRRALKARLQGEMEELAWLLFDYGYTVQEICGRLRKEDFSLPEFLNGLLLADLEKNLVSPMDPVAASKHIMGLTLLDFVSVVPFRTFYCRPSRTKEAMEMAKKVEKKSGVKASLYRRVLQLFQAYRETQPPLAAYYLEHRFSRAHGDYFPVKSGEHFGVDITRKFFFKYFDQRTVQEEALQAAKRLYSSKTSQEVAELLQLLLSALSRPDTVRGRQVQILGHIQSGAMGRVLLGVYRAEIVALKEAVVPPGSSMPLSEKVRQLEYEARIHGHVQSGEKQHENIVECFGIVEEEGHRYLAIGYHPAETLGSLVRRVQDNLAGHAGKARGPLLTMGEFGVISSQILSVLNHLRTRQVVHRDLKPANLLYLVDETGRVSLIKLIDFGVALGLAEGLPKDMFRRQVVGTMAYMAPEVVMAQSSYASDLYSAGVILYQVMSGKLPLELARPKNREDLKLQLKRVVTEQRKLLLHANPSLGKHPVLKELAQLVQCMIRMDPTTRPPVDFLARDWEEAWCRLPPESLEKPFPYSS